MYQKEGTFLNDIVTLAAGLIAMGFILAAALFIFRQLG